MNQDEEFKQQIQANDAGERISELEAENKSLRHILSLWKKTEAQKKIEELEDTNRKLRLELHTLRFKESQEQRFIWWVWNVYSRNVDDLIHAILGATTYDTEGEAKEGKWALPKHCFDLMKRIDEYTEHIYDGTYLDVEISADVKNTNPNYYNQPSKSDVSVTQDVLTDVKTGQSIEIEDLETVVEHLKIRLSEWQGVARQLADELVEANSERLPVSWEEPGETSRAMIAYRNLVDIEDMEANDAKQRIRNRCELRSAAKVHM